jgi:dTDP-4-amino-4,6-dideoxygalactose transaminase
MPSPGSRMIPFVNLQAQYRSIKEEVDCAIVRVLDTSQFVLGKEVAALEEEFASYLGVPLAIGVNSGTSALHLALLAAGIGVGDEVVTVPFTFVATVGAIEYTGARPVFVDIDPVSYTMDPALLARAITPRTKAIVPVHLYGQTADMDSILKLASAYEVPVIEDAAQAHGAKYKARHAGTFGEMACFSFYPGKNLGAYGQGGMVVTRNAEHARIIRMLRNWGAEQKYHHVIRGYNYRLDGIQAAILRVKLKHLNDWNEARRMHARRYDVGLLGTAVRTPIEMSYARHVYHIYAVRTKNRHALQCVLKAAGIETGIHYPFPVHLLPAYADLGYCKGDFPRAEEAAAQVLSLPMHPELQHVQVDAVMNAIRSFEHSSQ